MSGTSSLPIITTTTASDAPANSTDSGNNNNNNGGFSPPSSTLYLLTFLATLFVLLFVSCAIVLRSFFLRRRFRRHVEEQIAAGLMPPEAALHFPRRVDVGAKPTLYDVFIQPTGEPGETWDHISPVAAKIIMPDPPPDADEPPPAEPTPIASARRNRLSRLIPRRRAPPEPAVPPDSPQHEDFAAEGREMQVSVMVAMPGAHRMKDDGVPDVLLGVSQVSLRPNNSP